MARLGPLVVALALSSLTIAAVIASAPPPAIDGRSFSNIDIPAPAQRADVVVAARRVWTWEDDRTRRIFLNGAVRVDIGAYSFIADRATVWVEPVQFEGRPLEQFAVYFDNVRNTGADAAVAPSARRLLVTALVEGAVRMRADVLERARPGDAFVVEGEERLARYLRSVAREGADADEAAPPGEPRPRFPAGAVDPAPREGDDVEPIPLGENLPRVAQDPPIFPSSGVVTFSGPDRRLITGEDENALVITGGVVMHYTDAETDRRMQISAESLVAFLDPRSVADMIRLGPGDIRGVYLEGDVVATDGQYTLRGTRLFYDVRNNRGVALDAVFWTYDEARALPLYVRAKAIRQESAERWSAGDATLTNTAFFDPHLSLGVESLTLTRERREDGSGRAIVDARDVTIRAGDVPVFYVPRFHGEPVAGPLRRIAVETEDGDAIVRTRWNLPALLGMAPHENLRADLLVDGYFGRGPAVGLDLLWDSRDAKGEFFSYYIYDDGTDHLRSGARIDQDEEHRGMLAGEHRWQLSEEWTLFLEASYISDETFVGAFFDDLAATRREFANSLYVRRLEGNTLLSGEVRAAFNDFTPNEYLLQSLGYQVERLPEAVYFRIGDELAWGFLTHSSETRLGQVGLNFTEPTAAELGFDTERRSLAAFGLLPGESIANRLRAAGVPESEVFRFDTRHEFSAPLVAGPLNVTPFVVGRFTAYDDDFSELRGPGGEDDEYRVWGAAGVRVATSIVRQDDSVESRLFDLHRIRHIIEPSATFWTSGSSIEQGDLPIYDERVEAISDGSAFRAGMRNTWQTRRRTIDGERSVDWLVLDTHYVDASSDTNRVSPFGRFFEWRPELSSFGEFLTADASLRLTDAFVLTTTNIYDLEESEFSLAAAGVIIDHGHGFATFAEVRHLDPLDSTFINVGAEYELTRKYAVDGFLVYDVDESNFQSTGMRLRRRFPQLTVEVAVAYDDIREDFSVGLLVRPVGIGSETRSRVFTRFNDAFGAYETPPISRWRR